MDSSLVLNMKGFVGLKPGGLTALLLKTRLHRYVRKCCYIFLAVELSRSLPSILLIETFVQHHVMFAHAMPHYELTVPSTLATGLRLAGGDLM